MRSYFKNGYAVLLNVNNGGHWVLMTGFSGANFLVNDPGYSKSSYTQSQIVSSAFFTRPSGCSTRHLIAKENTEDLSLSEMEMPEFEAATILSEP